MVKNRIKVLRAERNWTQALLAERLGVSRQAINAIETGRHEPSLSLAFKICRLFETSIDHVFSEVPDETAAPQGDEAES